MARAGLYYFRQVTMAENATHVVLSQDELARFAEDSFIVVDNVFTRDEVEILRQACRAPEDQPWAQSERLIHSLELTVRHEACSATGAGPAHRLAPVKPKAGGISIHHGLALHRSGSNPSGAALSSSTGPTTRSNWPTESGKIPGS
jgi:hypothetical protein